MRKILRFLIGVVRDPVTRDLSSTRVAGLASVATGIYIGLHDFTAYKMASVFIAGGAVPFLSRNRGEASDTTDEGVI